MRELRGAFFLFAAIVLVSVGPYQYRGYKIEKERGAASSLTQTKATIRLGIDPYAGYFIFRSKAFRDRLLGEGYGLSLADDGGDYKRRVEALSRGEIDLAVFTVDSFLLNGRDRDYPGSIVAVLSESKGSDALVGRVDSVAGIDDLKDGTPRKIVFTGDSPSHHLLKAISVDFGLEELSGNRSWQRLVGGSEEALEELMSERVELAVLWEPDLSVALKDDRFVKLIGSESAAGLIVDVLVARHDFIQSEPEALSDFLGLYYSVLDDYRSNPLDLVEQIALDANVSEDSARTLIDGVEWKGLSENAFLWFGALQDGASPMYRLYDSIERTVGVLIEFGDFSTSPLPRGDPRSVIYDTVILDLLGGQSRNRAMAGAGSSRDFRPLNAEQWNSLQSVGTLKLRPISFQSGTAGLSPEGVSSIEEMVDILQNYPDFRILVAGHTSARGDAEANRQLSEERARSVAKYLVDHYAIDEDRVRAVGVGGEQPLRRLAGESYRAHQNRLSRVEFSFLRDTY
ncbi:OmpA family protein [Verrucomicrobiia bacterium DG1235]|nr:OmpA family protein [Verrucomicrobiae bacterium DG1235]